MKLFCDLCVVASLEQQFGNLPFPRTQTNRRFVHPKFPSLTKSMISREILCGCSSPALGGAASQASHTHPTLTIRKAIAFTLPPYCSFREKNFHIAQK